MTDDNVKVDETKEDAAQNDVVQEEVAQTITWERPSGTTITLADTENFKKLAKDNKWKRVKTGA